MSTDPAGKPFATARIARTPEYYADVYRASRAGKPVSWLYIPIAAGCLVTGFLLLSIRNHPVAWLAILFAFLLPFQRWLGRRNWMRNRMAGTPDSDNEMLFEFRPDSIIVSHAQRPVSLIGR